MNKSKRNNSIISSALYLTTFLCIICFFSDGLATAGNNVSSLKKDKLSLFNKQTLSADSTDSLGYEHPIQGTVYLDENGNRKQDETESGLAGVAVSDGVGVVLTNDSGRYLLPNAEGHAPFVFVHQTDDVKQNGQDFFHRLKYDAGAEERFDFGLQPASIAESLSDSTVRFVQLSDSHVRNVSDRDYMQQATNEIYEMDPAPDFVVATGDLVDWGVDEHFQNYVEGMQKPPIPYFNVFGNHEIVFGPIERYYHYIGPDYFSFERGGILFLALNSVKKTERQNEWLDRTLKLLGKNRPVVVFQHFPPGLEDLEHFGQRGVKSVFSGHWHSEKEMEYSDVQSINSPPFIMGGIDASPAGFKVVHLGADGSAETEWRYGFQEKQLTIVSPQDGGPVNSSSFPIIVNTYDTSHDIDSVTWRMGPENDPRGSGDLQQESAVSWTGAHGHSHGESSQDHSHNHSHTPLGSYPFEVKVQDKSGEIWSAQQQVEVTSESPAKPAPGGEWPMFMGNAAHTGYTSETIDDLPLRLAWSIDTGGDHDFTSPILADGRLYLALKKRTRDRLNGVAAFDPVTGERLWMFETPMAINHTPAYSEGVLCVAEMGGRIYGVDVATGKKRWHHDLIDNRGRYNYGAPAAHNGWFYAGVMRRMAKLRPADGHVEWEEQIGPSDNDWISSYGSPAVDGSYLAMSGMFFAGETVTIARTVDGSKVWGHTADDGMLASATITEDFVLFSSMKSILYLQRLSDGENLWSQELSTEEAKYNWAATTPAVKMTGKESGIVVAGSGDGRMSGVNLTDGQILWTHVSDSTIFKVSPYRRDSRPLLSSPTIAGDKVFFGSADGHVYGLDLETGEELWSYDIGASVMSTPLVTGNTVYVAAYDGRLYAFTAGTDN